MGKTASCCVVLSVAAAVVAVVALGWTVGKIRTFERSHPGCDVFGNAVRAAADNAKQAEEEEENTSPAQSETSSPAPTEMKVLGVEYDGDRVLDIHLSMRPDMDVVRRYVEASPLVEGTLGFSYRTRKNYKTGEFEPHLHVSGEFAYRTNVVLLVRKGLPLYDKGRDPSAPGALAGDWTYSFRRKDADPYVKFASGGRYLPPGGACAIAVESMNVTNVYTELRRVEPRNVVQLLARDEGVYSRRRWDPSVDDEDTSELAGACETNAETPLPSRRKYTGCRGG